MGTSEHSTWLGSAHLRFTIKISSTHTMTKHEVFLSCDVILSRDVFFVIIFHFEPYLSFLGLLFITMERLRLIRLHDLVPSALIGSLFIMNFISFILYICFHITLEFFWQFWVLNSSYGTLVKLIDVLFGFLRYTLTGFLVTIEGSAFDSTRFVTAGRHVSVSLVEKWSWCWGLWCWFVSSCSWGYAITFPGWVIELYFLGTSTSFILIALLTLDESCIFLSVSSHREISSLTQRAWATSTVSILVHISISWTATLGYCTFLVVLFCLFSCLSLLSSYEFDNSVDNI